MADTIVHEKIGSRSSLNVTVFSSSVHQYVNYSKKMQTRLAELNNNVSNVIKESCSGIDNICNRVRQCLYEMDQRYKPVSPTDEVTEYDIMEEKSRSLEDLSQEIDETIEDLSIVDTIEEEKLNMERNSEIMPSLTPFFTEINCNNDDPDNRESCRKQVLNKTIYSLLNRDESPNLQCSDSRISLDDFKDTITTLCNNFEMMNALVENINHEITKFSETTLNVEEKSVEDVKTKEVNKTVSGLKPIKRLSKSNSRQKSVQVGDCPSDTEVDFIELGNKNSSSFLIPDVYRKRAFTDLYQKLVAQVEANDSLIFFQTLMKRHKSLEKNKKTISQIKLNIPVMNYSVPKKSLSNSSNQMEPPKKVDLNKKYADSLWFSQRAMVRERSRSDSKKGSRKNARMRKASNKTVESKTLRAEESSERKGNQRKKTTASESNKSLAWGKHSPKFNSSENVTKKACSLECTCRMVVHNDMPASPSTKCHLQWLRAKPHATHQRKLKFLDILDDLTYRDLLPLQSEYPRKDHHQARELDYKSIHDTYLYKLLYGKHRSKDVWKQLLEPTSQTPKIYNQIRTPRTPNSKKVREEKANETFMEKFCSQNYSKSDILKRLSPYIYDSEKPQENYGQSVIVMPVRVYYDNFRTNEPTKLESPKKPFASVLRKGPAAPFNNVKWGRQSDLSAPKISKPMRVVYDSLPKKQEICPIATSIKPYAMPSKPVINSARLNVEKKMSKKFSSKSFPPKSFASYCQNVRNGKKGPVEEDPRENLAIYKKIQSDIEKIKQEINGKKVNPTDRKLWAHKYGKSMGQKLISFVEHQKTEEEKPLPLYALPKLEILSPLPERSPKMNFPQKSSPQKQVLQHIQNIKAKNETIQNNLKKAIEVIETRMVDILCDDSKSIQAFDVMEKEITNVLSLMKCQGRMDLKNISSKSWSGKDERRPNSTKDTNGSLEENYNIISEHLFERLERILDTGGSSMSNTSVYRTNQLKQQPKKLKEETRKKQKLSSSRRTKINIISPSSSASLEETAISRRLPKAFTKKTDRIEVQPQLSASTIALVAEPIPSDHWEHTCGDQNSTKDVPVESESRSDSKITEEDKSQNYEDHSWHNSSGDFIKQEEVMQKSDMSLDNAELKDMTIDMALSLEKVDSGDDIEQHIMEEEPENIVEKINSADKINSDDDIDEHLMEKESENSVENSADRINSDDDIEKYIMEKVPDDLNFEQNTDAFESLLNSDVEEFINDELNKVIDSIVSLGEQTDVEPNKPVERQSEKENLQLIDHCTPHGESLENKMQVAIKEDSSNYTEEVHKILKRMENIYSQLDDIQESESIDKIPVFREADISSVQSEIFLTPFMQAVKETRKTTKQNSKMALIEKSPSYYNVINFLDALTNLQKETPYEVYTATMHNYAHVYDQAKVYHRSEVWHEAQYSSSTSSKAGCLRKKSDETKQIKHRKVSFLQTGTEDKSNQVKLCPVHQGRVLRISSQQFPPMETSEEETDTEIRKEKTEMAEDGNDTQTELMKSCDSSKQQTQCESTETLSCEAFHPLEIKIGHEETRKHDVSVIDDKSTQVFCEMQAGENLEEISITDGVADEYKCPATNDDPFADCPDLEDNPDDSKSTERDFLDDSLQDPFYDYTNRTVTPKTVMQTIEGIYEDGNNPVPIQPRIVVFREVLESPLAPLAEEFKDAEDVERYKRRLEKRREIRMMRKSSSEMGRGKIAMAREDNENVVLLKSFYAIVYILMFTALSLDYRCI